MDCGDVASIARRPTNPSRSSSPTTGRRTRPPQIAAASGAIVRARAVAPGPVARETPGLARSARRVHSVPRCRRPAGARARSRARSRCSRHRAATSHGSRSTCSSRGAPPNAAVRGRSARVARARRGPRSVTPHDARLHADRRDAGPAFPAHRRDVVRAGPRGGGGRAVHGGARAWLVRVSCPANPTSSGLLFRQHTGPRYSTRPAASFARGCAAERRMGAGRTGRHTAA